MVKYDIAIIGGGVVGLSAAYHAAKHNLKTIIIEKNDTVGQKICANGLTQKDFDCNLPKELIKHKFSHLDIYYKKNKSILPIKNSILATCNRFELENYLLSKAINAGAKIAFNTLVKNIVQEKNIIITKKQQVKYDYLIGADGSTSLTRKILNIPTRKLSISWQYETKQKFRNISVYFNPDKLGPNYLWVFPNDNYTAIGTCADAHFHNLTKVKRFFCKYVINELRLDTKQSSLKGAPINFDYRGIKFGNIFLAGDAAGLNFGLTGEGIYQAIASGKEIIYKILDPSFNCPELKLILKKKRIFDMIYYGYIKHQKFGKLPYKSLPLLAKTPILQGILTNLLMNK